jgi:lipopolysaccharide export LptBFGC system permease protein LptF
MERKESLLLTLLLVGLVLFVVGIAGGVEVGKGITEPAFAILLIPGAVAVVVAAVMLAERRA